MLNIPLVNVREVDPAVQVFDLSSTCNSIDYLDNHLSNLCIYFEDLTTSPLTRRGVIKKIIDDFT